MKPPLHSMVAAVRRPAATNAGIDAAQPATAAHLDAGVRPLRASRHLADAS